MKISLNWLKEQKFFKCPLERFSSDKHLMEDLMNSMPLRGFEVEGIEVIGDDHVIEFSITPNRGDCMSMRGLAREIVAVFNQLLNINLQYQDRASGNDGAREGGSAYVAIKAPEACPLYTGCFIRNIPKNTKAPDWIIDRITKSGIEGIHPIVDICNYVMLELGQPLHAFDAKKIQSLEVRFAKAGEKVEVLGGQTLTLADNTLVIADEKGVQAVAGVIGGLHSGVSENTTEIFLESAHFVPEFIAGRARQYALNTEAAQRFERGVDTALPKAALAYAAQLIIEHLGGEAEEICVAVGEAISAAKTIQLRKARLLRILGLNDIENKIVEEILTQLAMQWKANQTGWEVIPPSFRFDILAEQGHPLAAEAALIEEIARIYGYDKIADKQPEIKHVAPPSDQRLNVIRNSLVQHGYREVISYSFISETLQQQCFPDVPAIKLKNPISSELAVMRTSLWPSLLATWEFNNNRQQNRARIFEVGRVYQNQFLDETKTFDQQTTLAGLVTGSVMPEQWGEKSIEVDFFDVKADVENFLNAIYFAGDLSFHPTQHPMLHPGQSAEIRLNKNEVRGFVGRLHPALERSFGFTTPVYLFEITRLEQYFGERPLVFENISKFPSVRRDFAFLVNRAQAVGDILDFVKEKLGGVCQEVILFDVYQGKNMPQDQKSIAFGILLQDINNTLSDDFVNEQSTVLLNALTEKFQMQLRDR